MGFSARTTSRGFELRIGAAKESYAADQALLTSAVQRFWMGALTIVLLAFPLLADDYWLLIACLIGINVTAATGLMVLTGFTGQVSLGHAAFMGVGAYAAAWLANTFGAPFWLALPFAGAMAALVGAVFGIPSLRVKGLYLALTTIAASFILHFVFFNWASVTGGSRGLTVAPASVFGRPLVSSRDLYWIAVPVAALAVWCAANLLRTRIGRAFIAIRDRDISAEVLGIHLFRYKLMSFALASFYAGVAGGVWLYLFRVVSPESFRLIDSIFFVAAIIVGGLSSIRGAIFGAAFMTLVPELLKIAVATLEPHWPGIVQVLSPVRTIVFGALIVGFLIFEPLGLNESWRRLRRRFELWPFRT
jgi:branched-chain amino acid transport system permease protein